MFDPIPPPPNPWLQALKSLLYVGLVAAALRYGGFHLAAERIEIHTGPKANTSPSDGGQKIPRDTSAK